jgi:hypothetical protein
MAHSPLLDPGRFSSFVIRYTFGRTPWMRDQPVARPLPTYRTAQTQNKRTQTSMPQVGFEPTIPEFERSKTVHVLDRAATVIDNYKWLVLEILRLNIRITDSKNVGAIYPEYDVNIVKWMTRTFLGNDLLTTFSSASARNNRRNVCSSLLGNRQRNNASYYVNGILWVRALTIAMQWLDKRSLNNKATVFRGVRAEGLSWRPSALQNSAQ